MERRNWNRSELILVMNLYCQLPFGKFHNANPEVIELAKAIDRTPSSVLMKLCNLASLDPHHQQRGVKGLTSTSKLDKDVWGEFHSNWERLAEESELLRENLGLSSPDKTESDISEFKGSTEGKKLVSVRLAQRFFRKTILACYESRCCVTGISIPSLLIASHVLPWSLYPERRVDPRNGLCLNVLHDKAFDRGLISFDEQWQMLLSKELQEATTNKVLSQSLLPFEGRSIQLPEKFRPDPQCLEIHRSTIFRA